MKIINAKLLVKTGPKVAFTLSIFIVNIGVGIDNIIKRESTKIDGLSIRKVLMNCFDKTQSTLLDN